MGALSASSAEPARRRALLLVVGSGRSGTSLFSGIAQRLGMHVPQPEVPADDTNPKGFAESQWVVDFHTRLLRLARVQVADARPDAWARTAQTGLQEDAERELRTWLKRQYAEADDLIIKDPRLSWFIPLWLRCAQHVGAAPSFVTLLRHPAAVIDSKQRWYGAGTGEIGRAAGWLNQTLFTERATREGSRSFIRYDDLVGDWTRPVARIAEELDLAAVRDAPTNAIRAAHEFVDERLSRSRTDWGDLRLPPMLLEQIEETWQLVDGLADGPPAAEAAARLDALRAAYIGYYAQAEGIAASSIAAARAEERDAARLAFARKALARVPVRYRRRVPEPLRAGVRRVLAGSKGAPSATVKPR